MSVLIALLADCPELSPSSHRQFSESGPIGTAAMVRSLTCAAAVAEAIFLSGWLLWNTEEQ